MQNLASLIRGIAERISESESKRKRLAGFVREISSDVEIKKPVAPEAPDSMKIAAVDGGLVKKSLHGMDCMLVRAAGVCFHYSGGRVARVEYHPSKNPTPRPEIFESLSEMEWNHFTSLNRLKEEITTAAACIERFRPDLLLLDGMILPHYLDRPAKSSSLYRTFENLLSEYRRLFQSAITNKTALASVIEDSRHVLFCEHLNSHILSKVKHQMISDISGLLKKTRDSNLLYLILEKGERTISFPIQNSLTLNFDLPLMRTFYLKTAKYDRPLKIDYIPQTISEDRLSSLLLSISGHHSGYGLPAPLIEADNVAKLSEQEMDNLYSNIRSLTGEIASTMKLRREQRPF